MILYDYWRSTASYRVRMALHLKGQPFKCIPINLKDSEQTSRTYLKVNAQGLVPALEVNGEIFTQSLAIIEYLDETCIGAPLMPTGEEGKAKVRALSHIISSDLHPLNNLRVLKYLQNELHVTDEDKQKWYEHWMHEAFTSLEQQTTDGALYLHGNHITMADICLIAQMYNAERFNIDTHLYPKLTAIYNHIKNKAEIKAAHPSRYKK